MGFSVQWAVIAVFAPYQYFLQQYQGEDIFKSAFARQFVFPNGI